MNTTAVDKIAQAILYEGYMLYPYRPSVKNHHRWTFGCICPRAYSQAQEGADAWTMQTECLVVGDNRTKLEMKVRFLHLVTRTAGEECHSTWQEAIEREIDLGQCLISDLLTRPRSIPFAFPYQRAVEPVGRSGERSAGLLVRQQQPVEGCAEIFARQRAEGVYKITLIISNQTPLADVRPGQYDRDAALMQSLVSTHSILRAQGGTFVSLMDPPEQYRRAASECRNVGTWPVLAGEAGVADTMLSAPIILYDYPQIALQSPGELFDGTEIDEILTLRIMGLTSEEKQEMAAVDERTKALLERTQTLTQEQLRALHGVLRKLPSEEQSHA